MVHTNTITTTQKMPPRVLFSSILLIPDKSKNLYFNTIYMFKNTSSITMNPSLRFTVVLLVQQVHARALRQEFVANTHAHNIRFFSE